MGVGVLVGVGVGVGVAVGVGMGVGVAVDVGVGVGVAVGVGVRVGEGTSRFTKRTASPTDSMTECCPVDNCLSNTNVCDSFMSTPETNAKSSASPPSTLIVWALHGLKYHSGW